MLPLTERKAIKRLMGQEIVPAIGCTEPIAVSLCVAKSSELLEHRPEKIDVFLSPNVIKNAMGVGIPGTKMNGLPIAIALGALIGKSKLGLEVLRNFDASDLEKAKQYIAEDRINISVKQGITEKLYIEVVSHWQNDKVKTIISGAHTFFSHIEKNGEILVSKEFEKIETTEESITLDLKKVFDYAHESPIEELEFIYTAAKMNEEVSVLSLENNYGHNVSQILGGKMGISVFGDNPHSKMLIATSGACDVRMDGAKVAVMSNSGSGNQGIAATMPVLSYAKEIGADEQTLIRALVLSNLCVIYIKQHLGRLSALCGCVVASTGSSCGITYLMGGNYEQITFATKNMIANITGMICDGAKPSCSLKISSGVSTALLSALMAIENKVISSQEGIVDSDVDKTIRNMAEIGNTGMIETDKMVLDIMTKKE
ncbi:MAG: L-serine ammonia-lyase, iron-sulfur-dependent, subunit alpha [Dysgonamonadaceae bacterium]|nr:L-serine ammonia-lyase, iron-sulfur-dependent, subunit alpha [Dysgonamonadaceae bacterium]MDD4728962.1 L-serine ammonia-lyase, iron-sulfur-dependent, subunit alpha [Dysgonamonadaceae bacterium]